MKYQNNKVIKIGNTAGEVQMEHARRSLVYFVDNITNTKVTSLQRAYIKYIEKRVCFYMWTVTNGAWAVIDFTKGIPAQGFLFTVYFLLAI